MNTFIKVIYRISIFMLFLINTAAGHSNYKGFSGAPGSLGTCTVSCHPVHYFEPDIAVEGFPEFYMPGHQYQISVDNLSGLKIHQFNASVRIGSGSENAGVILPGDGTAIYDTTGETNGVHWEWPNTDSGYFLWTAPEAGTGEVRLYWAGLQGYRTYGADTSLVQISNEMTTRIDVEPAHPQFLELKQNFPNPFNGNTKISYITIGPANLKFLIYDISGRQVYSSDLTAEEAGTHYINWEGTGNSNAPLPSGVYFYRLQSTQTTLTKKMILLR